MVAGGEGGAQGGVLSIDGDVVIRTTPFDDVSDAFHFASTVMLSPARCDEDDDSHLCIKCNATIMGLDNYVKHRREVCAKRKYDVIKTTSKTLAIDSLEPTYSLGADVFFQSLELQSSVKKTSISRLTPPVTAVKSTSSDDRKTIINSVPRMSPLATNLRGEDWIGGHSLRIGGNEDNQTRLINVVNNISGVSKKDSPSTSYNVEYYVFKDEEYDDDSEESEEEEDEEVPTTGGKWKPPPNHTGGKWRPASPDQDDWEEHSVGPWKSIMASDTHEREDDYDAPPPSHTKGKWVPGANEHKTQIMQNTIQCKGAVQYWCGVCNRRLGSRAIYERHLQSNLHLKKTLPETDLEFSGHMGQKDVKEKRNARPSQYVDNTMYEYTEKKNKSNSACYGEMVKKKKRRRKQMFIHCSGCKCRVRAHLMGKHLISHYHFRKTTCTTSKEYHNLILDNMLAIVHQSPFQCSPCKFYTNWMSHLLQHWCTDEHAQRMATIEGRYWCSFCKFECETSEGIIGHMTSSDHDEVVSVINRSMPIIMRKKTVFKCNVCFDEFRYNIALKKHCEKTGHELPVTATDIYQECHKCHICACKYKSSLSLAAHLKSEHNRGTFHCLVCNLTFGSALDAKRHRYTSAHRIRQLEKQSERGVPVKDLRKKCPYCSENVVLKNILLLKEHITKIHPDKKKTCSRCGKAFTLPQEVTMHVRKNACTFEDDAQPELLRIRVLWKCGECPFRTTSHAECLFHEVLHSKPESVVRNDVTKRTTHKYVCPLCSKIFAKESLRPHLRMHTFERPYSCGQCSANFTRPSALSSHTKAEHANATKTSHNKNTCDDGSQQLPLDGATSTQNHFACPHLECNYITNTAAKLASHRKIHGEIVKRHQCNICDFKSNQSSHLKRHMICHEGTKPYGCPHCDFICGSLENLRKHALKASKHPAWPLYECSDCTYSTFLAKSMRAHLTETHSHLYNTKTAAHKVKTHLLRKQFKTDNTTLA